MASRRTLPADATIGDRLRRLRTERGMTQEMLATRAGVSVDLVKKLEQGRRDSARLTTVIALADALDVSMTELTDKRPRLDGGDRLVLGIRDVLLDPAALPGLDPRDDTGEPTSLDQLHAAVEQGWVAYWAGQFAELATSLPGLLGEARATVAAAGAAAVQPLVQAHQLAASLLVHLGRDDLASVSAERGIAAAVGGDDELQAAVLYGTYAWSLISQGRHADASTVAARAADRIEPRFTTAPLPQLAVWGGLVLWAMAGAVEGGRPDLAQDYIAQARVGAARMDADRHDYQTNFGPTQVAMQATYAHAVAGHPGAALAAARGVRREDLHTISYARHLLDVASAHADARRREKAELVLRQAKDLAPTWFRHQVPARVLVADLAERQTRLSPGLRELLSSLDVHQRGGGT